jgi:hypothetical protein
VRRATVKTRPPPERYAAGQALGHTARVDACEGSLCRTVAAGSLPTADLPSTVRYVRSLRYDGSGQAVPLRGRSFIAITLSPAKAHNAHGTNVYEGAQLQQYRLPVLRGVAFTGDFEGQVSFGLALRHRSDFRVLELQSPSRIVIDVRH